MSKDTNINDFVKNHSSFGGNCLFNLIAEGLNKIFCDEKFTVENIKKECHKYAQNNDNGWVKAIVIDSVRNNNEDIPRKNEEIWRSYLLSLKYSFNDVFRMSNSENNLEKIIFKELTKCDFNNSCFAGICGRIDIEGKMITEIYNVGIKLVEENDILMIAHDNQSEISLYQNGLYHYAIKAVHKNRLEELPSKSSTKKDDKDCNSIKPVSSNPECSQSNYDNDLTSLKKDLQSFIIETKVNDLNKVKPNNSCEDDSIKSLELPENSNIVKNLNKLSLTSTPENGIESKTDNNFVNEKPLNPSKILDNKEINLNIPVEPNVPKINDNKTNSNTPTTLVENFSNEPKNKRDNQPKNNQQNDKMPPGKSTTNNKNSRRNRNRNNKKFVPRDGSQGSVASVNSSISSNSKVNNDQHEQFFDASSDPIVATDKINFGSGNYYIGENVSGVMRGYGKFYGNFPYQYIDAKWNGSQIIFLNICSFVESRGDNVSIKIYAEDHLMLLNKSIVCRIRLGFNFNINRDVPFDQIMKYIMNSINVVKIIEDTSIDKRNKLIDDLLNLLKNRINHTTHDLKCVNDFVQLSKLLTQQKYFNNNLALLQDIVANNIISQEVKTICQLCRNEEYKIQRECNTFPLIKKSRLETITDKLFTELNELYRNAIENHKLALINCFGSNANSKLPIANDLNRIQAYQVLYIHKENIELFSKIETFVNTKDDKFWTDFFLTLWENFIKVIQSLKHFDTLSKLPQFTCNHYLPLLKSFVELTEEIGTETKMPINEIIQKNKNKWKLAIKINWPSKTEVKNAIDHQYRFIFEQLCNIEPGNCNLQFNYNYFFDLFKNVRKCDLNKLDYGHKLWLGTLDYTLAKLMYGIPKSSKAAFSNLCISLLKCFYKFLEKKRKSHESLRMTVHNIIKFVAQISPYISKINLKSTIDEVILDKQIEFITHTMSQQQDSDLSHFFTNIIDVYGNYWINRDKVIAKFPTIYPCKTFETDTDQIYQLILTIAKEVFGALISNKITFDTLITFMRSFNEFVEDLDDIDFKWYVKFNIFYDSNGLELVNNKLATEEKRSYLVKHVQKFAQHLKSANQPMPLNYITTVIIYLLIVINNSLLKDTWPDNTKIPYSTRIILASSLLSAIRSSFLYLKEQPDYRDFDVFFEESTKPFFNILAESKCKKDFDERICTIKESYWYIRKQDEIGIDEAVKLFSSLNSSNVNCNPLQSAYNSYLNEFNKNIDIFYREKDLTQIVTNVKNLAKESKKRFNQNSTNIEIDIVQVPILLAGLAAVWSIKQSRDILNKEKSLKPHCIQILCIFRLLGVDSTESKIKNHLAQVLTGQGKSIILGLLSSLLALLGYNIQIVCYSDYLSKRDENDFEPFFNQFNLLDKIKYGTFEDMANDRLNVKNKKFGTSTSIRKLISNQILGKNISVSKSDQQYTIDDKTILLIDEVDVFFTDTFFGNTYNACSIIYMPLLADIQKEIWKMVTHQPGITTGEIYNKINILISDSVYQRKDMIFNSFYNNSNIHHLFNKNLKNKMLFEQELAKMVDNAISVARCGNLLDSHYKLNDKQEILYKDESSGKYCSHVLCGYLNIFNYFRLKVSNFDARDGKNFGYLNVSAGQISYAKLPNQYPLILGVSGTIAKLNESEKLAINDFYNIKSLSSIPSFFGHSNLRFANDCKIEYSERDWYRKIYSTTNAHVQLNRSVLIFFNTDIEMNEFEKKYEDEIQILNKLTINTVNKDLYINEAGVKRTVTLISREMGRGTDFKSSVTVEKMGGIHVIQTFFSLDEKEEIQIKGRTARKDNKGSYELILCQEHLTHLNMADGCDYYTLNRLRKIKSEEEGRSIINKINDAEIEHVKTMNFIKSLIH